MKKEKENLPTSGTNLGGGILEGKRNPGKFQKFSKNKKQKELLIGSIVILLLLVGGIYFYKTYALYEEKKEFNALKGIVPDFTTLTVKYIVDGKETITPPSKSESTLSQITCSGVKNYSWDNEMKKIKYNKSDITDKNIVCTVIFESPQMNDYLIDLSQTDTSIIKIEHEATNQTPALIDYRYVGKNPNNYVCFGSEEETCPEDNLYRIIGIIPTQSTNDGAYENRVKLIKNDYYTESKSGLLLATNSEYPAKGGYGYKWNTNVNNKWQESTLQKKVLNEVYWNSLGNYQKYIQQAKWYLGAPIYSGYTSYTPSQFYNKERSNTKGYSGGEVNMITNIGLMYPSDYGYSVENEFSNEIIYNNQKNYINNAWLYNLENKYFEWTISPESDSTSIIVFQLHFDGYVSFSIHHSSFIWGIRPTFYLKKEVKYASGEGTKDNPYKILI